MEVSLPEWAQYTASAIGLISFVVALIVLGTFRALRGSVGDFTTANEEYRKRNTELGQELEAKQVEFDRKHAQQQREFEIALTAQAKEFTQKLHDQELACTKQISDQAVAFTQKVSELTGMVQTYESGLAERLLTTVIELASKAGSPQEVTK